MMCMSKDTQSPLHGDLSKILKDLKEAHFDATRDLRQIPAATLGGFKSLQRRAQETLPKLRDEYEEALKPYLVAFFDVVGDVRNIPFPVFDSIAVYKKIAEAVWPSIDPRTLTFGPEHVFMCAEIVRQALSEIGHKGFVDITSNQRVAVASVQDLAYKVKDMIESKSGYDLQKIWLLRAIVDHAIGSGFDGVAGADFVVGVAGASTKDQAELGKMFKRVLSAVDLFVQKPAEVAPVVVSVADDSPEHTPAIQEGDEDLEDIQASAEALNLRPEKGPVLIKEGVRRRNNKASAI